jgi:hypothetical protein
LSENLQQLKQDVDWRKAEAERIGLGFSLTAKPSVGLLGLPEAKKYLPAKHLLRNRMCPFGNGKRGDRRAFAAAQHAVGCVRVGVLHKSETKKLVSA